MSPSINRGNFSALLQSGQTTYGTFLGLGTPLAAEIAAISGLDWVLLDLEHGASSESDIGATVVAASAYGIPTIVRVESSERIRIGRALDAGAAGLMIPRIETVEQVEAVIRHMTYPPKGERGVATYNRSAAWGTDVSGIYAGRESVCIIQIETLGALANVEKIAAIEGVDVLFVGPLDLSFALGVPQEFKNDKFLEATNRVILAAQAHGKVAVILAPDADAAQELSERGFKFVAVGSDSTILAKSIAQLVNQLKKSGK